MNKSTHFIGQPLYVQLLNYFNRDKILSLSQAQGGEHYIKKFDAWHHLVVILYAVMMRLDSLRERKASLFLYFFITLRLKRSCYCTSRRILFMQIEILSLF